MEDKKKLEQERNELNTLINKGVSFDVVDIEYYTVKKFFGLVKKKIPKEIKRTFKIQEPTLATLDRLSAEWVEIAIDDNALQSVDSMKAARTLTHDNAIRCARIIAIAALGEDRLIPRPGKGCTRWVEDTKKVEELTSLFARTIKPSKLYQIYVLISAMCNLGDFMNSIRLMSMERTTMPDQIEENNGV